MSDTNPTGTHQEATGGPLAAPEPESGAEDVQTPERTADGRLMVSATLGMVATAGPTLADLMGRQLYDAVNAELAKGQAAEQQLADVKRVVYRWVAAGLDIDAKQAFVDLLRELGVALNLSAADSDQYLGRS